MSIALPNKILPFSYQPDNLIQPSIWPINPTSPCPWERVASAWMLFYKYPLGCYSIS